MTLLELTFVVVVLPELILVMLVMLLVTLEILVVVVVVVVIVGVVWTWPSSLSSIVTVAELESNSAKEFDEEILTKKFSSSSSLESSVVLIETVFDVSFAENVKVLNFWL